MPFFSLVIVNQYFVLIVYFCRILSKIITYWWTDDCECLRSFEGLRETREVSACSIQGLVSTQQEVPVSVSYSCRAAKASRDLCSVSHSMPSVLFVFVFRCPEDLYQAD